jgi:hypothetical protein
MNRTTQAVPIENFHVNKIANKSVRLGLTAGSVVLKTLRQKVVNEVVLV